MTRTQVLLTMLGGILLAVAIFIGFYKPDAYRAAIGFSVVAGLCFFTNWIIKVHESRKKYADFWDDLTYMSFNVFQKRLHESLEIPASPYGGIMLYNLLLQSIIKESGGKVREHHREIVLQCIECLKAENIKKSELLRDRSSELLIEMRSTLSHDCLPENFTLPKEKENIVRIFECGGTQIVTRVVAKLINRVITTTGEEQTLAIEACMHCLRVLILDVQNNTFPGYFRSGDTLYFFRNQLIYELTEINKNPEWREYAIIIIRECFDDSVIRSYLDLTAPDLRRDFLDILQGVSTESSDKAVLHQ